MPQVRQSIEEIKHLVLLRKALLNKHSVEIYSRDPSMRLTIGDGQFYGGDCMEAICTMIENPVPEFSWEGIERKSVFIAKAPKQIFGQAIAAMNLNSERLDHYQQAFSRLPRVRLRLNSNFFSDKIIQAEYQLLLRLSLARRGVKIGNYLKDAAGLEQLKSRVGVVLASYCLGDLVSAKAFDKRTDNGVVARIMSRFRN